MQLRTVLYSGCFVLFCGFFVASPPPFKNASADRMVFWLLSLEQILSIWLLGQKCSQRCHRRMCWKCPHRTGPSVLVSPVEEERDSAWSTPLYRSRWFRRCLQQGWCYLEQRFSACCCLRKWRSNIFLIAFLFLLAPMLSQDFYGCVCSGYAQGQNNLLVLGMLHGCTVVHLLMQLFCFLQDLYVLAKASPKQVVQRCNSCSTPKDNQGQAGQSSQHVI